MAEFTPDGSGYSLTETGQLKLPEQPSFTASRSYLWQPEGKAIAVSFDDGRPFHRINLPESRPEATHDCPPDLYHVAYDFTDPSLWCSIWRVRGPRKDYVMMSEYSRFR